MKTLYLWNTLALYSNVLLESCTVLYWKFRFQPKKIQGDKLPVKKKLQPLKAIPLVGWCHSNIVSCHLHTWFPVCLTFIISSEEDALVNALLMKLIFTRKEVISTVKRPLTLEGGMMNVNHVKRTLMPETRKLTAAAVLMVLTVFKLTGAPWWTAMKSDCAGACFPCIFVASRTTKANVMHMVRQSTWWFYILLKVTPPEAEVNQGLKIIQILYSILAPYHTGSRKR